VPKTPDTLNESKQDELRREDKLKEAQESMDMRTVMALPEGRRLVYRILELCGCGVIYSDPRVLDLDGQADTHTTYCGIAQQNIGETLKLDILTLVPDLFTTMMTEAAQAAAQDIKAAQLKRAMQPGGPDEDD